MPVVDQSGPVTTSERQAVPVAQEVAIVAVTQADRDAVQAFHHVMLLRLMSDVKSQRPKLGDDEGDAGTLVQAFARHRLAATSLHDMQITPALPHPCKSGEGAGDKLAVRREVNTILSGLMQQLQPDCPDMVERIRLGNEACTAILALRTDATQTREAELHPSTEKLVDDFASELKGKLAKAERKYGYSDDWRTDDWEADCQYELSRHVQKGDPLDVAAYAAFCWARGYRTAPPRDDVIRTVTRDFVFTPEQQARLDRGMATVVSTRELIDVERAVAAVLVDEPLGKLRPRVEAAQDVINRMIPSEKLQHHASTLPLVEPVQSVDATQGCNRPPDGWWCCSEPGHHGPCPTRRMGEI